MSFLKFQDFRKAVQLQRMRRNGKAMIEILITMPHGPSPPAASCSEAASAGKASSSSTFRSASASISSGSSDPDVSNP